MGIQNSFLDALRARRRKDEEVFAPIPETERGTKRLQVANLLASIGGATAQTELQRRNALSVQENVQSGLGNIFEERVRAAQQGGITPTPQQPSEALPFIPSLGSDLSPFGQENLGPQVPSFTAFEETSAPARVPRGLGNQLAADIRNRISSEQQTQIDRQNEQTQQTFQNRIELEKLRLSERQQVQSEQESEATIRDRTRDDIRATESLQQLGGLRQRQGALADEQLNQLLGRRDVSEAENQVAIAEAQAQLESISSGTATPQEARRNTLNFVQGLQREGSAIPSSALSIFGGLINENDFKPPEEKEFLLNPDDPQTLLRNPNFTGEKTPDKPKGPPGNAVKSTRTVSGQQVQTLNNGGQTLTGANGNTIRFMPPRKGGIPEAFLRAVTNAPEAGHASVRIEGQEGVFEGTVQEIAALINQGENVTAVALSKF